MKDITVRLYKYHDYDLVYLYKKLQFPVRDAMKEALINYVRNEPKFFKIPVKQLQDDEEDTEQNICQFHIKLDETEYQDVIDFLDNLKDRKRNSFLKNLLRGYLAGPVAYVYEKEPNDDLTKKRMESIDSDILELKELKPLKKRKKKTKHIVLTSEQKQLFDLTGALKDEEVIISD